MTSPNKSVHMTNWLYLTFSGNM